MKKTYVALVGMDTPTGRFEPGDVVTGIAPATIPILIDQRAIAVKDGPQDPAAPDSGSGDDSGDSGPSAAGVDAPAASGGGTDSGEGD